MASRRSHAPSHSRTTTSQRSVPRGHVSIRNPLQAPKERSFGISITSSSLGSAKRDLLSSSTSYGMRQSIFGELYIGGGILCTHSSYSISLLSKAAWLRRDAIASYVCAASPSYQFKTFYALRIIR